VNGRFVIFLTILCGFLLGSGYYVGHRITTSLTWVSAPVVWVGVYTIILLQIAGPFVYRVLPSQQTAYFVGRWIVFSFMGIGATLVIYTLLADAGMLMMGFLYPQWAAVAAPYGVVVVLSMVVFSNLCGAMQMAAGPRVYKVDVHIPKSLQSLNGFKIAQISDLHVGPTISRRFVDKVVRRTNDLRPDMVALTGDLIDGLPDVLRPSCEPLRSLRSTHGAYAVLGNHEFYWRPAAWIEEYGRLGFKHLNNEHVVITHQNARIAVAGVPDRSAVAMSETLTYEPEKASLGIPDDTYKILLAHQPKSAKEAQSCGFHLMLSGHTHGGQFFPFTLLVRVAERFVRGLYRSGDLWVYVSRGTGYWGPPMRFLVPPEITLITLRAC
jgi:predicted MPP superfamily phosphohydrolase